MFVALGLLACTAQAQPSQQQLEQLRQDIGQLKQSVSTDKQRLQGYREELRNIEVSIARVTREQRQTEAELAEQRRTQHRLEQEIDNLKGSLAQQREGLARQIRAGFSAGQQQALKLLLNQTDPGDAGRTLTYYGYFTRAQLQAVEQTRRHIQQLDEAEERLQQNRASLETLRQRQQAQRDKLLQQQREREQVLSKLNTEINSKEQQLDKLLADEAALSKLLRDLAPQPAPQDYGDLGKLKGKLKWPTQGKILNRYGQRRGQGRLTWQGITIAGDSGQEIRAIAPGRVIFADWIRGYGLMLIVDHGNGYMSLYGHNQSLYKDVADSVAANEVVATLGNSGGNERASLYFEMRHRGKPVNPETWCR